MNRSSAERTISERGWLQLLPEDVRSQVLRRASLVHFAPGDAVFRLDDPPGGIYALVTGTVSISMAAAGATPRLNLLGIPGHWTGEGCFLTRQPRRGEIRAVADTTMFHVPLEALDQMAAHDPRIVRYVTLILMMTVDVLFRVIHDLQKPDADRRIAGVLQRTRPGPAKRRFSSPRPR